MKYVRMSLGALCGLLTSCLFNQPVFDKGTGKPDSSLAGVWVKADTRNDPRNAEYAVCVPVGDRMLIHHPAGPLAADGGSYYEASQITVHDRLLLQLRLVASFKTGPPKPAEKVWTVVWVERKDHHTLLVRSLKGEESINQDAASVRAVLEGPPAAWEARFGETQRFELLPSDG